MRKDTVDVYKVVMSLFNELTLQGVVVRQENHRRPAANMLERCHAFEEFCRSGRQPEFFMCTQMLQEWTRPQFRNLEAMPVLELGSRIQEILKNTCTSTGSTTHGLVQCGHLANPALVEKLELTFCQ